MYIFKRKNRSLGISTDRQKYDLPLNKDTGNRFLTTLMGLMAFLMMLTIAASFVLSAMNERWSKGLENRASVEISAQDAAGASLPQDAVDNITTEAYDFLDAHPAVLVAERMSPQDIAALVAPWLGSAGLDNVPLPGIISVQFKEEVIYDISSLESSLQEISPQIRLDTHESWLSDVLRFTGGIRLAALVMTLIITVTTIIAVGGAIQSRMAVYREELELLHLMGASDGYISKQLQRYAFLTILKGAALGMIGGWFMLFFIGWVAGRMDVSLLPEFTLGILQIAGLTLVPLVIAILGTLTARQTVLRFLRLMP
jgi:cell division transport system permease protein